MQFIANEKVNKINALSNDLDAIYHQASRKLGISDSTLIVLYEIYVNKGCCPLSAIIKNNGLSKQTANSSVRKLEAEGILRLEPYKGKAKLLRLTEKGNEYAEATAGQVFAAECSVFAGWTEEDINTYITLLEKYNVSLRKEIEQINT